MKRKLHNDNSKCRSPQEEVSHEHVSSPSHTITKNDLELQQNPAYDVNKPIVDTSPTYESCN